MNPTVIPAPGRELRAPDHVVVAVLDGGPDDAEVIDVAIELCAAHGGVLKVVHVCASATEKPTPLAVAYARDYVAGAVRVAQLAPGVHATALLLPNATWPTLAREFANAEVLVAPADHAGELWSAALPAAGSEPAGSEPVVVDRIAARLAVRAVRAGEPEPRHLRLGYRLALERELAREPRRPDRATTPEELDDAWHVGIAFPPLHAETLDAWAACRAWPPRTAAQELVSAR